MNMETKTTNCIRCGRLCQLAQRKGKGMPIRKSDVGGGCCVDCGITCFAKTSPLGEVLGGESSAPGFTVSGAFRLPHVQAQFAAVFTAGECEAGEEINWERVIENWNLPVPAGWDWGGEIYMFSKTKRRSR